MKTYVEVFFIVNNFLILYIDKRFQNNFMLSMNYFYAAQ